MSVDLSPFVKHSQSGQGGPEFKDLHDPVVSEDPQRGHDEGHLGSCDIMLIEVRCIQSVWDDRVLVFWMLK